MNSIKVNYFLVGAFTLLMVAGVVMAAAMLSGGTGATDRYYTRFGNVAGIGFGTQVMFEGFRVGQVEAVIPEREGSRQRFLVELAIAAGWPIPVDSEAKVEAPGLLSAVTLNITSGQSGETVPVDGVIPSRESPNMMATISTVAEQMADLSETTVKPLLNVVTTTLQNIDRMFNQDGAEILANLKVASADLARLTRELNDTRAVVHQAVLNADGLVGEGRVVVRRAGGALGGVESTMEAARGSLEEARQALTQVNAMLEENRGDVRHGVRDLRHALGSVARHIDAVNQNLDNATRNMSELSRRLKDNPGLLLGGGTPLVEPAQ